MMKKITAKHAITVLIVEDDQGLNKLIQNKLRKEGYTVECSFDGRTGLEKLGRNSSFLILLDYKLPDMTAIEFIEAQQKQKKDTPFIVMTGQGDEKIAVDLMKMGAEDYIVKTTDFLDSLIAAVRNADKVIAHRLQLVAARAALQVSEIRYKELFDVIKNGVAVYEASGEGENFIFKEFNKAGEKIENVERDAIIGKRVTEVFPGVKKFGIFSVFQRVFRSGEPEFYPETYYEDNRIAGWRENYVYKLPSGEIVSVYEDITERKRTKEQIQASLKEKVVIMKEIHHRVKNNLQTISSLLNLQCQQIKDIKIRELFKESQNRIKSMALIHEKLYQSDNLASIDIVGYIKSLVRGIYSSYKINPDKIRLRINIDPVSLSIEQAIPCGLIINELVSNAFKYAFPESFCGKQTIEISLKSQNAETFILKVSDNGVGLPENIDLNKTKSLVLHLVKIIAEDQLEGSVKLSRRAGTQFQIKFKRLVK
ncbi:response regulator [candidate division KSB1 bacterium]|nr:response regulator [candidate division KSB1 bacterium]